MTATTSSGQPGPDPQSTHRGPANQPERPGTIPWELLGARDYRAALTDLGSWLAWLVPTYRIPPSVIPPCWFLHPGLIEELGHLWTGWRVTQHPDTGVGMIGLEWDGHRERATGRLRELVATAGCNATTHSVKPGPGLNRDDELWVASLESETTCRIARSADQAARTAARELLSKAEQRKELALNILRDIATDPGHPTRPEMDQATIAVENMAQVTSAEAQVRGREARTHLSFAEHQARLDWQLAAAREDLLIQIAAGAATAELAGSTRRWLAAVKLAHPTNEALSVAAASIAGEIAAAKHLASSTLRHRNIEHIMPLACDD